MRQKCSKNTKPIIKEHWVHFMLTSDSWVCSLPWIVVEMLVVLCIYLLFSLLKCCLVWIYVDLVYDAIVCEFVCAPVLLCLSFCLLLHINPWVWGVWWKHSAKEWVLQNLLSLHIIPLWVTVCSLLMIASNSSDDVWEMHWSIGVAMSLGFILLLSRIIILGFTLGP